MPHVKRRERDVSNNTANFSRNDFILNDDSLPVRIRNLGFSDGTDGKAKGDRKEGARGEGEEGRKARTTVVDIPEERKAALPPATFVIRNGFTGSPPGGEADDERY